MLTISLITVIFGSLIFIIKLRNIQKHDAVLFELCNYRRDLMGYLRNEYETLSKEDYKETLKLLDAINSLIGIYSKRQSDLFHLKTFFSLLTFIAKKSYPVDRRISSMDVENESILELQKKLSYNIKWAVFKSTPKIKVYLILFFALLIHGVRYIFYFKKAKMSIHSWYVDLLKTMTKENFSNLRHT